MASATNVGTAGTISFTGSRGSIPVFPSRCQDDVGWFNVAMEDRWLLMMQIGQSIDDRCYNDENLGQRKALLWLLSSQDFQVRSFNVLHEQIGSITLLTVEHTIDAGQRWVMKLLE